MIKNYFSKQWKKSDLIMRRNKVIALAKKIVLREVEKYLSENRVYINLFNTGIVLDSKALIEYSKRYFKTKK
jgi:hypothetical protein